MMLNIEVNKIFSHPDNPRRDLGDFTELASSIKANGILQNLTVVPWFSTITRQPADDASMDGYYVAVIGHRRLAAAKLAGLTEVPCMVSNMDSRKQVATMLLENIQRNDLTVYEQAQGFQMMLDLGESIDGISEQTGFSESTVRRRMKLLELDQSELKKSVERGATLMDFGELDKIENVDTRNEVLKKIGTRDFNFELQRVISKEKSDKQTLAMIEEIKTYATEIKNIREDLKYVDSWYASNSKKIKKPDDVDTTEYYYRVSDYGSITLYCNKVIIPEEKEVDERRELMRNNAAELKEISKLAHQLRKSYALGITNAFAKKNLPTIMQYAMKALIEACNGTDIYLIAESLGIEYDTKEIEYEDLAEKINEQNERCLAISVYATIDSNHLSYYDWQANYEQDQELDAVYEFLEKIGYQISEEENMLKTGTHKLFVKTQE